MTLNFWSSVDRARMTDAYLFIFLTGPIGYPVPITDVGEDAAKAAYDFAVSHIPPKRGQYAAA